MFLKSITLHKLTLGWRGWAGAFGGRTAGPDRGSCTRHILPEPDTTPQARNNAVQLKLDVSLGALKARQLSFQRVHPAVGSAEFQSQLSSLSIDVLKTDLKIAFLVLHTALSATAVFKRHVVVLLCNLKKVILALTT